MDSRKTRSRRSNSLCPSINWCVLEPETNATVVPKAMTPLERCPVMEAPSSPVFTIKHEPSRRHHLVYDSDDARDELSDNQRGSDEENETDTDSENRPVIPIRQPRKITMAESFTKRFPSRLRRNSEDPRSSQFMRTASSRHANIPEMSQTTPSKLSDAQKRGCFQYMKRRHSVAMAFASTNLDHHGNSNLMDDTDTEADSGRTHWEFVKVKHGVQVFKSSRSRCEIRGVTRVHGSVKNVMSLLAAGESTESFAHTQNVLLGRDQVLEARVLASCVPSSASRYFHCGLKYMAMKNPFGLHPLDLVFLDYTDVSTTPEGKLIGYRIIESIRVPEYRSVSKYIRASIRCEVYIVRETDVAGVVEVTFASHLDPKSKYFASKRHTWLDQTVVRLSNLRDYAEKATFSNRLLLEKAKLVKSETRHNCFLCDSSFSFLRKRHNCRLCGEVACGRCCRKLPIFVGTETTRVRVCLGCMLRSRRQPDELGRENVVRSRRESIGNCTWIAYDEVESVMNED